MLVGFFQGGGRVYVGVALVGAAFCAGDPAMLFKALELLAQRAFGAAGGMHYLLDGVGIPFRVACPKQSKDVLCDLGIPLREVLPFPVPDLLKAFEYFLVRPLEGGGDPGSFLADSDITAELDRSGIFLIDKGDLDLDGIAGGVVLQCVDFFHAMPFDGLQRAFPARKLQSNERGRTIHIADTRCRHRGPLNE